ncbi:MAG: hypothetical protein JAZ20_14560 [Candidatus Thiodiazotropha weberae]|nr:hypothetical protein [Candidatus Thiodiazotropha lotti]MCG8011905.1 hypothetical protein [Candidatus Thiodiazotropha lotti]MCG8021628.1 hypothetical protein [Candidatus Thiodiazotropha lotti]MCW4208797.1 hypothetical protein [Candidatus Thiodiazotropha lotti]MCW4211372.1 hypothetical protein [Candidatus Thiodiazotropha lotti]
MQRRNGYSDLNDQFESLKSSQYLRPDEIKAIQLNKLKKLLKYSYANIPFYHDRFKKAGFNPTDFKTLEDLKIIPLLTKDDIRKNSSQLINNEDKNKDNYIVTLSGGTTGPSIEIYNSKQTIAAKIASQHRFDSWAGWTKGDWSSIIWPAVVDFSKKPPSFKSKIRNYLSDRMLLLQQSVINEDQFQEHFSDVLIKKPSVVRGFPTQLYLAAKYAIENGLKFPFISGVISTGEVLLPEQRLLIQQAFECPVYNSYRTREVGCIAQECSEQNGFHVNSEQLYVEIVWDRPNLEDGVGKIVVTDLENTTMPFIRYEIGDLGRLTESSCECGRGLPLLENIGGRISDQLYSTTGKQISPVTVLPNMFHLLGINNQFRIIQEQFNVITIMMVKPELNTNKLNEQKRAARIIFGDDVVLNYQYVDKIEPVSSGKFPIVISKIEH